jgi:UDP-3-O-[3-hydroxymyristoyl] glucosamine N-acyltransferase
MTETVGSLAKFVGGTVHGDAERVIAGVGDLRFAGADRIGFLRDPKLADAARVSRIGALVVDAVIETSAAQIVVEEVDVAFARIAGRFHPTPRATEHAVHPSASVAAGAVLEAPVQVGPCAVIERGASVGAGTVVGAGAVVGEDTRVGRDCLLYPRVVLYPRITLGDRVLVHAGAVIGSDGFGYARDRDGAWVKWPQLGTVTIEDDVEIGANVTIDRAALGATKIGRGTKIDNLVHIAHNCTLGQHVAIAGFSALSGSVTLGDRVQLAGHTVSSGHLKVAADVRIGGCSVITTDVPQSGDYMGFPVMDKQKWMRTLGWITRLPELATEVRDLQRGRKPGGGGMRGRDDRRGDRRDDREGRRDPRRDERRRP